MNIIFILTLIVWSPFLMAKSETFFWMGRPFTFVSPEAKPTSPRPLLVLLHGCTQSSEIILNGTEMAKEAEKNQFYILVPEQTNFHNPKFCWNWFLPIHQQRLLGNEMHQVISALDLVMALNPIDTNRVFVTGLSAGGALTHNLSVCYPDYFSGAAVHSGLAYKVAENVSEAETVLTTTDLKSPDYLGEQAYICGRSVSQRKMKKLMVIHGDLDKRVIAYHGKFIADSNDVLMDYLDDGRKNHSASFVITESNIFFPHGFEVIKTEKVYDHNGFQEQTLLIRGLAHAWGGGKDITINFNSLAPSSNDFILNFFELK